MKTLTETFNEISVQKGEKFAIELKSNPTTGYSWDFKVVAGQATSVRNDGIPDVWPGKRVVGSGITDRRVFSADALGTIEIEASYSRPWEKNPPAQKHRFKINVSA